MRDYIAMALIIATPWSFVGLLWFATEAAVKRENRS